MLERGEKSKTVVSACVACVDLIFECTNLAQTQSQAGKALLATVVCFCSSVTFCIVYILLSLECLWLSSAGRLCLLVDCIVFLCCFVAMLGFVSFVYYLEIKRKQFFKKG